MSFMLFKLSSDQFISMLKDLETFIFRRMICSITQRNLTSFIIELESILYHKEGNHKNYDQKLKEVLSQETGSNRFPRNEEFKRDFSTFVFVKKNKTS